MFCYGYKMLRSLESKHFLVIWAWERSIIVQRGVDLDNIISLILMDFMNTISTEVWIYKHPVCSYFYCSIIHV